MGSAAPVSPGVVGAVGGGDAMDAALLGNVDPIHSRSKGIGRRMRR
jgi:hypothetical protein